MSEPTGGHEDSLIEIHLGADAKHATWLNALYEYDFPGLGHPLLADADGHPLVSAFVPNMVLVVLILSVVAFIGSRRLGNLPRGKLQTLMTMAYHYFLHLTRQVIGEEGPRYAPLLGTYFTFILTMNLLGLVPGFLSPTASLSTTATLALSVFVFVQYFGVRAHGLAGYARHFIGDPWWLAPLNIPIHVVGELARPLSLALRLRGNIFGEDMAILIFIGLSAALVPLLHVPLPLQLPMLAFGVFGSVVQALVFTMLSAVYIGGAVAHQEGH